MSIQRVRFISAAAFLLLAFRALASAGAPVAAIEVRAPRNLQLAVVDERKPSPARDALHRALVACLAARTKDGKSGPMGIAVACLGASDARARLRSGACDGVLVIANDRPVALRRLEAVTLCGELEPAVGARPFYLIVRDEPDSAGPVLGRAFATLVADRPALKAIVAAGDGAVLAAAGVQMAGLAP